MMVLFLGVSFGSLQAQDDPTPTIISKVKSSPKAKETKSGSELSYEEQKRKLELERLDLENEKLKLEMERMKMQGQQSNENKDEEKAKEIELFQQKASEKAEALAKKNKKKADLLVFDFVNSEFWYLGVRYNIHDFYSMAEDLKMPIKKYLDKRDFDNDERNKYLIKNISLLRYSRRSRGILTIKAPAEKDDFKIMSVEGVTSDSNIGDVRNAFQSVYYKYDGEGHRDKFKTLKYVHSRGLDFADKLEFGFDKDGKLAEIRYGVLDEN